MPGSFPPSHPPGSGTGVTGTLRPGCFPINCYFLIPLAVRRAASWLQLLRARPAAGCPPAAAEGRRDTARLSPAGSPSPAHRGAGAGREGRHSPILSARCSRPGVPIPALPARYSQPGTPSPALPALAVLAGCAGRAEPGTGAVTAGGDPAELSGVPEGSVRRGQPRSCPAVTARRRGGPGRAGAGAALPAPR